MKQPELGKKLLELRRHKGLTQEELVEQCNISVRTIQRIESGEVMPRSYTVKTILHALDSDLEQLYVSESKTAKEFKELFLLDVNDEKEANFLNQQLTIAWIAGLVYFIGGIFEFAADWSLLNDNEMIFGKAGYIIIKLLVMLSFVLFMRGFILSGKIFKNYLLKIAALLLMMIAVIFYLYDIVSVFLELLDLQYLLISEAIIYGFVGVFFGIALFRLQRALGILAAAAGVIEIIIGVCMLSIILSFLGLMLLVPAIMIEIVLLFKINSMLKEKQREIL